MNDFKAVGLIYIVCKNSEAVYKELTRSVHALVTIQWIPAYACDPNFNHKINIITHRSEDKNLFYLYW